MPIRQASAADAPQSSSNHSPQNVFRGRVLIESALNGFDFGSSQRLLQNLGIQPQFIAEVIIYSGNIRSRRHTNFANRGRLIAPVSKNLPGNIQQLLAGWV